jgi:hypothetical protein
MDRYGDHIEADFASRYPGVDPGELWRNRKWRKLLNLINHLPRDSHFLDATAQDEEHVELLVKATEGQPKKEYAPPGSQWDVRAELLAQAVDKLDQVITVLVAANGGKPGKPNMTPRPTTKFSSVEAKRLQSRHDALVRRVLPHKRKVE